MKLSRVKNWITTVIGTLLMLGSGIHFFMEENLGYNLAVFGVGFLLLFAKDELKKSFLGFVNRSK